MAGDTDDGTERFSFLGRRLPPGFAARVVTVPPGGGRHYDDADFGDALVVVERGQVELECLGGSRRRFAAGDLLCLDGLGVRTLHNPGRAPAVLVAVSRRSGVTGPCPDR
jgi:hypothetical protein